jgi:hypothetical protein
VLLYQKNYLFGKSSDSPPSSFFPARSKKKIHKVSLSNGKFNVCPIQTIGQQPLAPLVAGKEAQCCVKTGYVTGSDYFVSKIAAGGGE